MPERRCYDGVCFYFWIEKMSKLFIQKQLFNFFVAHTYSENNKIIQKKKGNHFYEQH